MWYSASIFLQSAHQADEPVASLWEESVVLVRAESEREAHSAAEELGRRREHSYSVATPKRHSVRWRFVKVERVFLIEQDQLTAGTEVFARYLRAAEAESLMTKFDD